MSEKNEWKLAPTEATPEMVAGYWDCARQPLSDAEFPRAIYRAMLALAPAPSAPGDAQDDAKDAARWRFIRRKLCLTGNGDGTCGMHAINLPASIPGWPDPGAAVAEFCDAAIDAAIASQHGEGGAT